MTLLSFNARPIENVRLDWIGEIYLAVRAGQVRRLQGVRDTVRPAIKARASN